MKVERVSYEVMTPSAARGLLQSVLWQPSFAWCVTHIHVLAPVRWTSFRRNEVKSKATPGRKEPYLADEDRDQRNTVALRDVDYVIEATLALTDLARPGDTITKYEEMFERRVSKGQHHSAPFLGCREFAADVLSAEGHPAPVECVSRPLGSMFWDFDWANQGAQASPEPLFFQASLKNGVVHVPSIDEVKAVLP